MERKKLERKTVIDARRGSKASALLKLLSGHQTGLFAVLAGLYIVPLLVLMLFGLAFIWQQGWMLWFSFIFLLITALVFVIRLIINRAPDRGDQTIPSLQAKSEWSPAENKIWLQAKGNIEAQQWTSLIWTKIPQALLEQLSFIAQCYHRDKADAQFAFSLPEALLLCETVSRDYRAFVIQNIPMSRTVKLSTLRKFYLRRQPLGRAYKTGSYTFRVLRLLGNPLTAVINEIRDSFANSMIFGFSDRMQRNLKQVLFEEVSQVGINLYSGRLKLSDAELAVFQERTVETLEPAKTKALTVLVLGQVNAGKSSLVNALTNNDLAEVDVIPATDGFNRHQCLIHDEFSVTLIDSPGIDGNEKTQTKLLNQAIEADLILWTCQANQPAKKLDQEFLSRWQQHFREHPERRPPPLILVTTHNDMLMPFDEWDPPYNLIASNDIKTNNILDALNYTREVLKLDDNWASVPIALPPSAQPYNIDSLRDLIIDLAENAKASQRNRDRLKAISNRSLMKTTWKQSVQLGKVIGKIAVSQYINQDKKHS